MFGNKSSRGPIEDAVDEERLLRGNRALWIPVVLVGVAGAALRFWLHLYGFVGPALLGVSGLGLLWLAVNELQWRKARRNLPVQATDDQRAP